MDSKTFVELTHEQWVEQYRPVKDAQGNIRAFETYGDDYEAVLNADPACVWTRCDSSGFDYISSGNHWVDRFEYYITEVAVEADIEAEVDLTSECVKTETHFYDENDECLGCGRYKDDEDDE